MTGPGGGRITAQSSYAGGNIQAAQGPLDWGDKCFLCSNTINIDTPPVEAREFYISKNGGMLLCHASCIREMEIAGGTPTDFHMARQKAGKPVMPKPEEEEIKPPRMEQGAAWLHFDKLADYNAYVRNNPIDESIKVTVGNQLLQAGE